MKNSILTFLLTCLFITTSFENYANNYSENLIIEPTSGSFDFIASFSKVLKNAKAYTLEVAEAMPAEDYNFKTADSVRTFGEQLAHIGMSSTFILTKLIKGEELPESDVTEETIGASKEKTIALLTMAFDNLIATLESMDSAQLEEKFVVIFLPEKPEFTKMEGFIFLRDHITHHRGQAIVYLRAKGHKAPRYRSF